MRVTQRSAKPRDNRFAANKSFARRETRIDQFPSAPFAFHFARELFHLLTVTPHRPHGSDIRTHARSRDHIYFDASLEMQKLKIHRTRTSLVSSDHLPLVAGFCAGAGPFGPFSAAAGGATLTLSP